MKIYAIKGVEGTPGYVKQSMKLPKSWGTKQLKDVLELFVETYNKKAEAKLDADAWHLERPLGSTLFPDDQVETTLADYCDVWIVEGAVRYKGPPPGTAAAAEAREAEERKEIEKKAAEANVEDEDEVASAQKAQWAIRVKCVAVDRGSMNVKSQYKVGDVVVVKIEPYATVGMLMSRIGLMVGAHPKHQKLVHPKNARALEDPLAKLKDVTTERALLELSIFVPTVKKAVGADLSDDEGCSGPEALDPPAAPSTAEGSDPTKQTELKAAGDEKASTGDVEGAIALYSEALALGGPSALLVCKRADALLKLQRPTAAKQDATAALALNPDSAKAYKIRAKANRMLGDYEGAVADYGQAQRIDFDDAITADQAYVVNRLKKIRANAIADAENHSKGEAQPTDGQK